MLRICHHSMLYVHHDSNFRLQRYSWWDVMRSLTVLVLSAKTFQLTGPAPVHDIYTYTGKLGECEPHYVSLTGGVEDM